MEQQKLTNVKEALSFLAERFPKCFVLDGNVKPLKIGIFQDLAKDLDESEVVSKRLLRMSLRHYTSGWKYLASVKEGNQRVDLAGELGDKVEAEHAQHAQEQLKESKAKAAQKRQERKPEQNPERKPDASKPSRAKTPGAAKVKKVHTPKRKVNTPSTPKMQVAPLSESTLKVGLKVSVKVGREPMPATVTDISKDGVFVQLNSGMTVKVQQQQLRVIVE